jgi:hypothetical protein
VRKILAELLYWVSDMELKSSSIGDSDFYKSCSYKWGTSVKDEIGKVEEQSGI